MTKHAPKNSPRSLDVSRLDQLTEPFTVQVQKIKAGQFSPIPLPVGVDGIAGAGWSKQEVLSIDQGWLVNHWSGGGMYEVTITDSSVPSQSLSWRPFWPIAEYPEKVPPTLTDSSRMAQIILPSQSIQPVQSTQSSQPQPIQPQQQIQQVQSNMTQFPNGLPGGGIPLTPAGYPQPQAQPQPFVGYQPMQYQQQPQYQGYNQADIERRRLEEKLAQVESAFAKQREEALAAQHQVNLERERAANQAAVNRLEQKLAELMQAMQSQANSSPKVNPEVEALREANRLQQAQIEAERREREAERREREMRELITSQNLATQRQIEAMQQNHQALMTAQANKGPDPMISMMIEQNRQSMDALKEISRQSSAGIEKFQQFMMTPRDMLAMTKDASNGIDSVTAKMAGVYGNVLDMHQKVLENALNLNQGGSETVGLIREGVNGVKELAERYVITKSKEAQMVTQAQAQAVQAQAQSAAVQAQSQAAIAQAQANIHNSQPQPQQTPRPPATVTPIRPQQGLGNATPEVTPSGPKSFEEWKKARDLEGTAANGTEASRATPIARRHGKSDQEWFGPFLDEVNQLRTGVQDFLDGLKKSPPVIQGASPETVAKGIVTAMGVVLQNNLPIPAMTELLGHGHYVEFLEVLLPTAPETLRTDIVKALAAITGDNSSIEQNEETEDEDGEDSDDVRDGSVA